MTSDPWEAMDEARMLMIDAIPRLKNQVLKWKNAAENKEQELKTAVATVNKLGQFMITEFLVQILNSWMLWKY